MQPLLKLYINGNSAKSQRAIENLKYICSQYLKGDYQVDVVDISEKPEEAENDQIIAIPTLVKLLPPPPNKIVGDLTAVEKVVQQLGFLEHTDYDIQK